ncbi:hypothetical protein ACHAWF_013773, partial [Thalassiosira exigua]
GGRPPAPPAPATSELRPDRRAPWSAFLSGLEEECASSEDEGDGGGDEGSSSPPSCATGEEGGRRVAEPAPRSARASGSDVAREEGGRNERPAAPDWKNPGGVGSLYLRDLRARARLGTTMPHGEVEARPSDAIGATELPPSLPLREWIGRFAGAGRSAIAARRGGAIESADEAYLEAAVRVALSLANVVSERCDVEQCDDEDGGSGALCENDICIENVTVTNTKRGEADFRERSGSSDGPASLPEQRIVIERLSRIYFELFTRQIFPSSPPEESRAPEARQSSSEPKCFDSALTISDVGECRGSNDNDRDDGRGSRKQRRRTGAAAKARSPRDILERSGLPISVRRLVTDMLPPSDGEGELFRPDRSVASLSDVISDLSQMRDEPDSFLHDASLLSRFAPAIPAKLYGRERELTTCLDVARGVFDGSRTDGAEDSPPRRSPRAAIAIAGGAGSGKSRLMDEVSRRLEMEGGWRTLRCKFDREARQPLATIASAFDRFLIDERGVAGCRDVAARVREAFGADGVDEIAHFVPSLARKDESSRDGTSRQHGASQQRPFSFDGRDAAASKCRLQNIFGALLEALSGPERPLLLLMDDLQWADASSLELLGSLVDGVGERRFRDETTNEPSKVLLVCGFRDDDQVEAEGPSTLIEGMKACRRIDLNEIRLNGISRDDVNALVSDSLRYPRRLTRSLSNLICGKSGGNPFFVKEFVNSLFSENLLTYSFSRCEWQFDEEVIELRTVSDGVADILARRLQRLPQDVLSGLRVMSCFGSEVNAEVLIHVKNICGVSDIMGALDCATKESLLIKKQKPDDVSYSFVHDMIRDTVYHGIEKDARLQILKEVADALIAKTSEDRSDSILYTVVDFINRAGRAFTQDSEKRDLSSKFNLLAGEKALPDFVSASNYFESGISYLGEDCWSNGYDVSLALHKKSAQVHWTLGKPRSMNQRIDTVMENAKCFGDTLDCILVRINWLLMDGKSGALALSRTLEVLEQLGESFTEDTDVGEELTTVRQSLPVDLNDLPPMKDPTKIRAMDFLYIAIHQSHRLKNKIFPFVACRMVKLTVEYGINIYSPLGFSGMAMSCKCAKDFLSDMRFSPHLFIAHMSTWKMPWSIEITQTGIAWEKLPLLLRRISHKSFRTSFD